MKQHYLSLVLFLSSLVWCQVDGSFVDTHDATVLSGWETIGTRTWAVNSGAVSSANNANQGFLLRTEVAANEGAFDAELSTDAWSGDQLGLVFAYRSSSEYYYLTFIRQNPGSGVVRLFKGAMSGAPVKEVGSLTITDTSTIRVQWTTSQLTVRIAGVAVLSYTDATGFSGRIGYGHAASWSASGSILQSSFTPSYTSWTYSGLIHVNASATGLALTADQSQVFVPVDLGPADVQWGTMSPDGSDLRFVDAQGLIVPYQIERWQPATGSGKIWLRLNSVTQLPQDNVIQAYWGHSGTTVVSDPNLFIGANTQAWHQVTLNAQQPQESLPISFTAGLSLSGLFESVSGVGRIMEVPGLFRLEILSPSQLRFSVTGQAPIEVPVIASTLLHHFSVEYGVDKSLIFYLDGSIIQTLVNITAPVTVITLIMGGEAWAGSIDELRIGAPMNASRVTMEAMLLLSNTWRNYELGGSGLLAPSDFLAVSSGSTIDLTWKDQSNDEDGFLLRVGSTAGAWTSTITIPANAVSTSVPKVTCGGPWYFELVSVRGQTESASVTAGPIVASSCPANLQSVTPVSSDKMLVIWSGNSLVYELQGKQTNETDWSLLYTGPFKTFTQQNLVCESEYNYRVHSTDIATYSMVKAVSTGLCPPALALNIIASASIPGQIHLTWTRDGVNPDSWLIYRKAASETAYVLLGSPSYAGIETYSDATVACGDVYNYQIRSLKNSVYSEYSEPVSVTAAFCGADKQSRDLVLVQGMAMNASNTPIQGTKGMTINLFTNWDASGVSVYTETFPDAVLRNGYFQVALGLRGDALAVIRKYQNLYYTLVVDGVSQGPARPLAGNAYSVVNEWALSGIGNPISLQAQALPGATYVDVQGKRLFLKTGADLADWVEFAPSVP